MSRSRFEQAAYSQVDAAAVLGVSLSTLSRMIKAGQLRAVRLGQRRLMIARAELERLLNTAPEPRQAGEPVPERRTRGEREPA